MTVDAPPVTRPPRWRRALRGLWLVLVVVAIVFALINRWEEVTDSWRALSPLGLAGASVTALVGVAASCAVWRTYLGGLGHRLKLTTSGRIFFVAQLGKFMPGSIWPVLAQMEYGRDHGVAPRSSAAALALFLTSMLSSGALIAALVLPAAGLIGPWWAAIAVPALALMVPTLQGRLLTGVLQLLRRQPLPDLPDTRTGLMATGWALLTWAVWGLHLWMLIAALGYSISPLTATGVFAAAWLLGFAVLPAPAGAGIREAVIIALTVSFMPAGAGLTVVLVSRLLLTVADVAWGGVGLAGVKPAVLNRGG